MIQHFILSALLLLWLMPEGTKFPELSLFVSCLHVQRTMETFWCPVNCLCFLTLILSNAFHNQVVVTNSLTCSWAVEILIWAPLHLLVPSHSSVPPPSPPALLLPPPPDAALPGGCGWGRTGRGKRPRNSGQVSPGWKRRKMTRRRILADSRPQTSSQTRWKPAAGGRWSSPARCPEPKTHPHLLTADPPGRKKKIYIYI